MRKWVLACLVVALAGAPAFAQQTGTIAGKVTLDDGSVLPGVTIEATSSVLPQPRQTVTGGTGEYRLPLLPPGTYMLTFNLQGMATEKRTAAVALQQTTFANVVMTLAAVEERIEVVAQASLIDTSSGELKAAMTAEEIDALPVGQQYRDLVKLIPGVQYTEDGTRGPAAGGSGQDNVYNFDGVNVNRPLFGTLSAEPSSHDIDQFAVVKGGADATDFNRSAGISINSVSKSGTNAFHGSVSYQIQPRDLIADRTNQSAAQFEEEKDWVVANVGGPIVRDRLYFYASYYTPTSTRQNRANLYGEVPDYKSTRDEFFGKVTLSPTNSLLLNGSYRTSDREDRHTSVSGDASAASTSDGGKTQLDIAILEGNWVINDSSFVTFKYTDFGEKNSGKPDTVFDFTPALDGSVDLNVGALDTQGYVLVPVLVAGQDAYNAFVTPIIERYGYLQDGVRKGGGRVGGASQFNNQDFYRQSYEAGYDILFGSTVSHELHVGYQWAKEEEDLYRISNGWGQIEVPGGRLTCGSGTGCQGQPIYYQARVQQQGILNVPTIHSEYVQQNVEVNDAIKWDNFTFNVGVLVSNDKLYGQGLKAKSGTVSGFELDPASKYLMHEIKFADTIQPRLGVVWAYSGANTAYANYARYIPASSSLPRAASWARNLATERWVYFDADGNYIGNEQVAASSGKIFQPGIKPRATDEYLLGTTRDLGNGWNGRAHVRYRYSYNFWEDTNNNARSRFNPPEGIPTDDYVPNLGDIRAEIGGSSYVIAELDGSFTRYYEAGLESEWRGRNAYFRGSYVWSHYYGNMDQDASAGGALANDSDIFIGSSNIADGAGRQLWDFKYGNLRGDRRHQLKLWGYYTFDWKGSAGAYVIYQSGQPWEMHSYEPYISQTTSTSDTNRYAEWAGSHRTPSHYQLDLNYTQNFSLGGAFNLQARLDVYNVLDKQTGKDVQWNFHSANYGAYSSFYNPRRIQLAIKLEF